MTKILLQAAKGAAVFVGILLLAPFLPLFLFYEMGRDDAVGRCKDPL